VSGARRRVGCLGGRRSPRRGTIKNHVSNILSKLGVRDRTRAVLKAFELQLV
jgi:DNA-binding NarL/FixJ family response regulator